MDSWNFLLWTCPIWLATGLFIYGIWTLDLSVVQQVALTLAGGGIGGLIGLGLGTR